MRNIIIVECKSTGINFIEDIIKRGHNPVVLECKTGDSEKSEAYAEAVHKRYNEIKHAFDLIYEQDTYKETLEIVKKYDPLLVLPGNEKGVILASKLSHDLGLLCNPIENLDAMTLKNEMQNKIAEYGLRSIRGKVVRTQEEAIEFYDSEGLEQVVLKPVYSAGSASVRICLNKEEMINSLKELMTQSNYYGEELHELLIQERIVGDEYIVNTVSCEGHHRVTLVWKYHKVKTSDGAIIYDTCETVDELGIGEAEMIEYAYNVADALGIQYGPVHGEYMMDEKGPVLIEVNCRPCGGNMPAKFLNNISGQHETDSILDAYLKPERFYEQIKHKYQLYAHGALKFFIVPKNLIAISSPIGNISIKLESHIKTDIDQIDYEDKKTFFKTNDLDSSCGIVYLVNEDYRVLQHDIDYLRDVEKHAFSLVLAEDEPIEKSEINLDKIGKLLKRIDKHGTGLFVTDNFIDDADIMQIPLTGINDIGDDFDFILVNLNESMVENSHDHIVRILLDIFSKVKVSGIIFIPKSTYQLLQSRRRGMEALLKVLNFKIELPPYGMEDNIVASRR